MGRYLSIADEGRWLMLANVLLVALLWRYYGPQAAAPAMLLLVFLYLLFRDPARRVPPRALGVIAPVDGRVKLVEPTSKGQLEREAMRILISVNHLGTYTARSPVEGKVLNLQDNLEAGSRMTGVGGLWVRTDEGEDVVVLMRRWIAGIRPVSFIGYGERLGQGQRFALLRLTREVEVYVPLECKITVEKGDGVRAGETVLAELPGD